MWFILILWMKLVICILYIWGRLNLKKIWCMIYMKIEIRVLNGKKIMQFCNIHNHLLLDLYACSFERLIEGLHVRNRWSWPYPRSPLSLHGCASQYMRSRLHLWKIFYSLFLSSNSLRRCHRCIVFWAIYNLS